MGNPDNLEALIASQAMERLEIYLRNGRRLRDVPLDTLRTLWLQEMRAWEKAWTDDHRTKFDHREHEDIESEMALRKIDPPFDEIKDQYARGTAGKGWRYGVQKRPVQAAPV
jgi:hypothetical protein